MVKVVGWQIIEEELELHWVTSDLVAALDHHIDHLRDK
jgi:hypothetical protein